MLQSIKKHLIGTIDKDMIEKCIIPHLVKGKRGFAPTVPLTSIVSAILYRLKTGCQWRELPMKEFFGEGSIQWLTVFHRFNKWSKSGCWQAVFVNLLRSNHKYFDLSSVQIDGSHTPSKHGGAEVGY